MRYILWKLVGRRPALCLMAVVALLLGGMGHAQAAERDRLQAFLSVTGFDVALDSIALSAKDAPAMLGMDSSDFGDAWSTTADEVFDTQNMRDTAMDILEQTLDDDLLAHTAAFYASDLGQKLVQVENAAHMADDDEKAEIGENLVHRMVQEDEPRLTVLRNLTRAVNSDDVSVRAVQEIQVRFLMAASYAGVLDTELDEGNLRAILRENEDDLRQSLRKSSVVAAAYTYRDIPEGDLQAYLEALQDPKMQRVYELMNAVQYEIMASRFEGLAARMAEIEKGQDL